MSDTVFTVIFWVGLAASLFSLGLIGLTVFLWARDVWVTHRIHRMSEIRRMDRLRELAGDGIKHDESFVRTLDEIRNLPMRQPSGRDVAHES